MLNTTPTIKWRNELTALTSITAEVKRDSATLPDLPEIAQVQAQIAVLLFRIPGLSATEITNEWKALRNHHI